MDNFGITIMLLSVSVGYGIPRGKTTEELCSSVNGEALYSNGRCVTLLMPGTYGTNAAARCSRGDVLGVPGGRLADLDDIDVYTAFRANLKGILQCLGLPPDKYMADTCTANLVTVCEVRGAWVPASANIIYAGNGTIVEP